MVLKILHLPHVVIDPVILLQNLTYTELTKAIITTQSSLCSNISICYAHSSSIVLSQVESK